MTRHQAAPMLALALIGLLSQSCAAPPSDIRFQGVTVPRAWIERAENGGEGAAGGGQAQACLALSRKLWDCDVLESIRYVRKGALLRDPDCCRQYLAYAETPTLNLSQRVYARLFIEGLLRQGPILTPGGQDIRGELFYQLCWAWRCTEPRCPAKMKQVLETMFQHHITPELDRSSFLAGLIQETGVRRDSIVRKAPARGDIQLYAPESAEISADWRRVPLNPDRRGSPDWDHSEGNAWGGGTDRLLTSATVLAFLANGRGEPSFRGTHLWICNLGDKPVYLSSADTGFSNRELPPGREEVLPVTTLGTDKAATTTGIPLSVRHLYSR